MSIIDTLITNRTQADVDALLVLYAKPKAMWTADEWNEFLLGDHRGAYNASDMNRVLDALDYLAERVKEFGYRKPEIKRPSITEVIPGTSRLPEGYTELEYIESSGTQYIDTGFAPNQDSRVDAVFETAQTGGCGIAVADQEWQSNGFGIWGNAACYGSTTSQDVVFYDKGKILVSLNKNNLYEDGELIWTATSATFQVPVNMTLFALNRNGSVYEKTTMTLYSCQIYDNGILVRDYVPCLNPSNEVGLYDIVNGEFYGNAGTGEFIAGEVVESTSRTTTTTIVRDYYAIGDRPPVSELAQYLTNVAAIRAVLDIPSDIPPVPTDISQRITIEDANNIEIILTAVESLLNRISLSWFYSGEVYSGEV